MTWSKHSGPGAMPTGSSTIVIEAASTWRSVTPSGWVRPVFNALWAGSTGDSYDNALAESIIGLFKTEIIHKRGPWKSIDPVEYAILEWVDWFNNRRLLGPIGDVPPAEFERAYYEQLEESASAA